MTYIIKTVTLNPAVSVPIMTVVTCTFEENTLFFVGIVNNVADILFDTNQIIKYVYIMGFISCGN